MSHLDPKTTTIEVDGRTVTLKDLAEARDFVRSSHMALDPYPMVGVQVRDSGAGGGAFTITGHAAVFNRTSLDLGGFTESIDPAFFDDVLAAEPDVHALWDHDTRWALARTVNNTLELRVDEDGLHNWMRVAPTSYAEDLRVLMERGDVDQESFAFTVAEDDWEMDEDGAVHRTLLKAAQLFDVTITAKGAYPQTSASISRSIRQVLGEPKTSIIVPEITASTTTDHDTTTVTTDIANLNLLPVPDSGTDPAVALEPADAEDRTAADVDVDGAESESQQGPDEENREHAEFKARVELRRLKLAELQERLGQL